VPFPTCGQW
jgi:hypothetical protein